MEPTMDAQTLSSKFLQLKTDLDRSLRYYAVMRARCALWSFVVQALCVLTASSTFVAAAGGSSPPLMMVLAFLAAVCSCISLAERASARADWYLQKRKSFSDLMGRIPLDEEQYSVETLQNLTCERLMLEADESPVYGCLSVLCHNEVCEAYGKPEYKCELTWMQRHVWRFFPVSYKTPTKGKDHERNESSGD